MIKTYIDKDDIKMIINNRIFYIQQTIESGNIYPAYYDRIIDHLEAIVHEVDKLDSIEKVIKLSEEEADILANHLEHDIKIERIEE